VVYLWFDRSRRGPAPQLDLAERKCWKKHDQLYQFSAAFIRRPVATALVTIALGLAALSRIDFPRGAPPAVDIRPSNGRALRRSPGDDGIPPWRHPRAQFGRIAGITEMSSTSVLGSTALTASVRSEPQHRRAARESRPRSTRRAASCLPTFLPRLLEEEQPRRAAHHHPVARHEHRAGRPASMTSRRPSFMQKLSQIRASTVGIGGSALPGVRVTLDPTLFESLRSEPRRCADRTGRGQCQSAQGRFHGSDSVLVVRTDDQFARSRTYRLCDRLPRRRAVRAGRCRHRRPIVEDGRNSGTPT